MNIFWAPKSSNKKLYNFKNKKLEKKVWKTKKMKNKIELFGHQKVQIFWVTKKKLNFLEKKFKKFREFFLKKKQKWNFFELLELFDFF